VDSDLTAAKSWLLNIQRKLYKWSKEHPDKAFEDLWSWITDPRNLKLAFHRVATNKGRNTPGIDGMTMKKIQNKIGEAQYLSSLRDEWRSGRYKPSPVRRKWIPKLGKPNKFRGLGIPTIDDRIIQSAVKQIIEPIFEARFMHVSHGFRPGRAVRDAMAEIRNIMHTRTPDKITGKRSKPPYDWVIEGDIQSCFDQIDHHALMQRVRKGIADRKVNRLITAFLQAGVMEELQLVKTHAGTPQGGILSPLLANIALSAIEERYRRWFYPQDRKYPIASAYQNRKRDAANQIAAFFPIRYADDFLLFCIGTREQAEAEKEQLAIYLKQELGLTLSHEKTRITALTAGVDFLGYRIRSRMSSKFGWILLTHIPSQAKALLRQKIKALTKRNTTFYSFMGLLKKVNSLLKGWGYFYRHASFAWDAFNDLDCFAFHRIERWLRRKHPGTGIRELYRKYYGRAGSGQQLRWCEGDIFIFRLAEIRWGYWDLRKRKLPPFIFATGEPGA